MKLLLGAALNGAPNIWQIDGVNGGVLRGILIKMPCGASLKRPLGQYTRVRSLRDGRGWEHVRLVDFGQPVGRYTDLAVALKLG